MPPNAHASSPRQAPETGPELSQAWVFLSSGLPFTPIGEYSYADVILCRHNLHRSVSLMCSAAASNGVSPCSRSISEKAWAVCVFLLSIVPAREGIPVS